MIIITIIIKSTHIGFEVAGTDEDTNVKNMAYDNNIVTENPTNTNTLNFTSVAANAKLDYFSPNSDWTLQEHSTNVEEWHSQSVFKVTLQVKRQPLYYTVMVVIPTLLFAVLDPLVFLLPVESGE
jgi:hypothetical protein